MGKNFKSILAVCLSIVLFISFLPIAVTAEDNGTIQQKSDVLTSAYGVTSIQYAMMKKGEIISSGTSGVYSKSGNEPLAADTMYGIGSVSKLFTTTVILKLVDDGKIQLDKPVVTYLPEFTMQDERYKDITVRMLLNHSSGLPGSTYGNGFLWDDSDSTAHDTLLEDLKTQRLKAAPGAFSVYCNDGFTLAEIVSERVSGKSFTELVNEYIITPLSLDYTKTSAENFDKTSLARTYNPYNPASELANETINVIGTGGIYSTASELCAFGKIFTGEANILSDKSAAAAMEKEYLKGQWLTEGNNIFGYGLGFDCVDSYPFNTYGIKAIVKGGDTMLYHSSVIILPEYDMTAVVISSGGTGIYNQILATNMLLEQLKKDGAIKEITPDYTPSSPVKKAYNPEKDFSGLYASSTALYDVTIDKESLKFRNAYESETNADATQVLISTGDGKYMDSTGSAIIYFLEQDGKTYLCQDGYITLPGVGQTYMRQYVAQKLDKYDIPEEASDAWKARNSVPYLIANAKYTSMVYSFTLPMLGVGLTEKTRGYFVGNKIISSDLAEYAVSIPMLSGRDVMDFSFEIINGVEYCKASDSVYMSLTAIEVLYGGDSSICTIQDSGYTRWFTIGESLEGKTITVKVPENAGFAIYSSSGYATNHTAVSGDFTAELNAGGFIAFIGDPGTVFEITISD